MKVAIVCALALASLVNGENGIREASRNELEAGLKNPYGHLLRTRRFTDNEGCTPRSTTMMDCNSCFCLDDGSGWACTEMACPPTSTERNPSERAIREIHGQSSPGEKKQICTPGSRTYVECNTCTCSQDGTALGCTRMECI